MAIRSKGGGLLAVIFCYEFVAVTVAYLCTRSNGSFLLFSLLVRLVFD